MTHRRIAAAFIALSLAVAPWTARASLPDRAAASTGRVEPGLLAVRAPVDVLVRFRDRVPALGIAGLTVRHRFVALPAVAARATPAAVRALAALPGLAYLERDHPIAFDLDHATIASRAADVWGGEDPLGFDGSGVGIAILDTGLDGLHPDFAAPGKVGGNWIVTPEGDFVPAVTTVTGSAHGTHVAGIAAGNGATSGGTFRGAAPGATLYAFALEAHTFSHPVRVFDWILQHGRDQQPPIRVVNNSWRCGGVACPAFDPDQLHIRYASLLAEAGIVVTWSAGNSGGDGTTPIITPAARNQTPGIISVANYDDEDRGKRDGCVVRSSSRGAASDPTTWPDLAAPGTNIMSTWATGEGPDVTPISGAPPNRVPGAGPVPSQNDYRVLSGTSMAAPHVAGVVALMLDARSDLSPAQVEYLLKSTARKLIGCPPRGSDPVPLEYVRADPTHTHDGSNYVAGHGLVDARAAVEAALAFTSIPPAPDPEPIPERFLTLRRAVEVERRLYLRFDPDRLDPERSGARANVRVVHGDAPATFTSAPFGEAYETSGITVDAWIGTSGELVQTKFADPADYEVTVEHVRDGVATPIAYRRESMRSVTPGYPLFRQFVFPLDDPVLFEPGDAVRVALNMISIPPAVDGAAEFVWTLYADADTTPSSIALGRRVDRVAPGSDLECQVRFDCTEIGGERRFVAFYCAWLDSGEANHFSVRWEGPSGTGAALVCEGHAVAVCFVAEEPDGWGSCESRTANDVQIKGYNNVCMYLTRDGEPVDGRGRCTGDIPPTDGEGG